MTLDEMAAIEALAAQVTAEPDVEGQCSRCRVAHTTAAELGAAVPILCAALRDARAARNEALAGQDAAIDLHRAARARAERAEADARNARSALAVWWTS